LGVSQPDYGMLFHDMHVANGDEIAPGKLIQPKVEAEIAFILGHDLMHEKLTTADVLTTIAWAVPALEIVDSRIEAWNIRIAGTVADNASLPWLARVMAKAARPLRSGDVVLERRTGPMVPAKPGTALEAWTQGLGSVRLAFGKD
jgi:2-keto-4-pentenoate hydratase